MTTGKAMRALVTGASSGIGAVYADRLARRGYDLTLVARGPSRLEAVAVAIRAAYDVAVDTMPADLCDRRDVAALVAHLREDERFSLLINSAGVSPHGTTASTAVNELDQLVAINVDALHALTIGAAQVFGGRGGGAVINIGSVTSLMLEQFNPSYAASKAFVLTLTQSLAAEYADAGVRFQAVLPGLTRTALFERSGVDIATLPEHMVMEAGDLVDAALRGYDLGETVTIPSLEDDKLWKAYETARSSLAPYLSLNRPASRYTSQRSASTVGGSSYRTVDTA